MRLLSRMVVAVAVLSVAACTASAPRSESAPVNEVRIGVLVPKSGESAAAGAEVLRGAELAAALVNGEEGAVSLAGAGSEGLAGFGGAKLTIVAGDTKAPPRTGPPRRTAWSPRSGWPGWSAPTTRP
jgi:hypothetical protein